MYYNIFSRFKIQQITINRVLRSLANRAINFVYFVVSFSYSIERPKKGNDKMCILLANGPSLSKLNADDLGNLDVYGMNRIYLKEDIKDKLKGIFVVNKLVASQFRDELISLGIPIYIPTSLIGIFKKSRTDLIKYSRFNPLKGGFGSNSLFHINPGSTVTYFAFQILLEMGYKKILVIGLDHDFGSQISVNSMEIVEKDNSHFHPDYFPKGSKWDTPDLLGNNYWYKKARAEFENKGCEIIDVTLNGKCRVFRRSTLKAEL